MRQNKDLLFLVKEADKEVELFYHYLWKKYPKIQVWTSGCMELNSKSFGIDVEVAEAIHPRRIDKWRDTSGW